LLPRKFFKKGDHKISPLNLADTSVANVSRSNRYEKKYDINQYLDEGRVSEDISFPTYRKSTRKRPESLFKIP
jgi:hypothetical protein